MAADLAFAAANGTAASPTIRRRALFDDVYYSGGPSRANYAVAPDDRHFLFTRSFGDASRNVVTLNWFEDVKARAAGR
jgi:hypothetical protein